MITVSIMSYRYGHLIAQAIESILSQTQLPSHVIIVDDGAGDVAPVAQKYLPDFQRLDVDARLIDRGRNLGIVDNFNDVLLNAVQTPRVMFLGADNYLRPDALERLSKVQADIVSCDIALFGAEAANFAAKVKAREMRDGYHIWRFVKGDIRRANYIHGSSLYNAELAKRFGYRASGHWYTEEDWMLFRAMLAAGATHAHVPEPLLFYRRHRLNYHPVAGSDREPRSKPRGTVAQRAYWRVAARVKRWREAEEREIGTNP
jgi:glycosyltransferase involved in cell wall biosynthesis